TGAYFLDALVLLVADLALGVGVQFLDLAQAVLVFGTLVLRIALHVVYFTVPEGLWGVSPGKLALGLRVRKVSNNDRSGLGRALGRTLAFGLLVNLGSLVWLALHGAEMVARQGVVYRSALEMALDFSLPPLVGTAVGIGLMAGTMRRRNGYRGLHEF